MIIFSDYIYIYIKPGIIELAKIVICDEIIRNLLFYHCIGHYNPSYTFLDIIYR